MSLVLDGLRKSLISGNSSGKPKLTKSRFKLALECPVKLYYTGKPGEYPDAKLDDAFLHALAEGGFQVGELAKLYYDGQDALVSNAVMDDRLYSTDGQDVLVSDADKDVRLHPTGGHNISAIDYDTAIEETNKLLKQNKVTIFEAAVMYDNFFIRIDILKKHGSTLKLIEVKAKSIDPDTYNGFTNPDGNIKKEWSQYLYDVAFQKYVLSNAFPEYKVSAFLMLADKNAKASVDGLNQRFFLKKDKKGRTSVKVTDKSDTGNRLLAEIRVDNEAEVIYNNRYTLEGRDLSFKEYVNALAKAYADNSKIKHPIGDQCRECEFNAPEEELHGKRSGFRECWREQARFTDKDFKEQLIFDLWSFRGKQKLIDNKIYFIKQVDENSFPEQRRKKPGLTENERKILQIQKVKKRDNTPFIDSKGINAEMKAWKYPLHFIDFETTMTAIPFNKGRHPYEGIAFQFSHHIVYDTGLVEHKGQYLNTAQGYFPNYDLMRALKKELDADNGSIFRYSPHENTFLAMIYKQLHEDNKIRDRKELSSFIETISHSNSNSVKKWSGKRDMIDLWDIVKRYYYHPVMKGSNSIKAVLPAVMESSFIQKKYSKPVYGGIGNIKSFNFKDQVWIQKDDKGKIISPYKLLPPLFEGIDQDELDSFITDESLADGGAAMTAYARMQFTEMTKIERQKITEGLLRYCELDTLAMVMIYEYFKNH
jgi:hypothetical protein